MCLGWQNRVSGCGGASLSLLGLRFVQPPPCAQLNSFAVGQAAVSVCPGAVMGRMIVQTTVMKKTVRTQVESPWGAPGPCPHVGSGRQRRRGNIAIAFSSVAWTSPALPSEQGQIQVQEQSGVA